MYDPVPPRNTDNNSPTSLSQEDIDLGIGVLEMLVEAEKEIPDKEGRRAKHVRASAGSFCQNVTSRGSAEKILRCLVTIMAGDVASERAKEIAAIQHETIMALIGVIEEGE